MFAKVKYWRKERRVSQLALQSVAVLNCPSHGGNQCQNYNNQRNNQSIMGNNSLIVFGTIVISIFMPLMLIQTKMISISNPLPYYIIFMVSSICLPSLYFLLKPKCLTAVFNVIFQSWDKSGVNFFPYAYHTWLFCISMLEIPTWMVNVVCKITSLFMFVISVKSNRKQKSLPKSYLSCSSLISCLCRYTYPK